jgi:hypothetical protein
MYNFDVNKPVKGQDIYYAKDMTELRQMAIRLFAKLNPKRKYVYTYLMVWEGKYDPYTSKKRPKWAIMWGSTFSLNEFELDCFEYDSNGGFGKKVWYIEPRPMYHTVHGNGWKSVY